MNSNCYIIYDEAYEDCIVIDPASEKCVQEQSFFDKSGRKPSFVILTHEHTDHTWGVNTLVDKYEVQVICSKACADNLEKESYAYFRLYYNNPDYTYNVKRVDHFVEDLDFNLKWHGHLIEFILTPGHSMGSICVLIKNMLFTGDTWMQYKPYINKRRGSFEAYNKSLSELHARFDHQHISIMPGHGEMFLAK